MYFWRAQTGDVCLMEWMLHQMESATLLTAYKAAESQTFSPFFAVVGKWLRVPRA